MKVLLIGSGGREHTIADAISHSPLLDKLYCAPGNAGISEVAECVNIGAEDINQLHAFVTDNAIDLVIIGPERPLILGLADRLRADGVAVFGPNANAAQLEGSKAFTNEILSKYGLTKKRFDVFDDPEEAKAYICKYGAPVVVKADGDAFGKGVKVCDSVEEAEAFVDECMIEKAFGASGDRVVIEECLVGEECSILVFTDGETVVPMVASQDHKRIGRGDTGLNTGGMGCYSPVPNVSTELLEMIVNDIVTPTVKAMEKEGCPYSGTLYAGCILTADGPELIEYNCRFGDPETQVVIPRLESDLLEVLTATAKGELASIQLQWSDQVAACVVLASGGYPGSYEKGKKITGLDEAAAMEDVKVYHAGTRLDDGDIVTAGGRVLGVTGLGDDYDAAFARAYAAIEKISFAGMYYRDDIGWRARANFSYDN